MSIEVTKAFVEQFNDNVIILSQQMESRLRGAVRSKPITGDAAYFERIGATNMSVRSSRHEPTVLVSTPHSRRRVSTSDFVWADMVDKNDENKMLISPASSYAQNAAAAANRKMDDLIIAAATGDAISVTSSLAATTSTVALPAGQIVDDDFGTTDSNLTVPKLIEAKRILRKNEIMKGEKLYCVLNASAEAALLNTLQFTSRDYTDRPALQNGEVVSFMGFTFIQSERILGTADGTGTDPVLVLAFTESAIGLAVGQDVITSIDRRPDINNGLQIHLSMTMGATRIEDEKMVSIQCVQAA